MRTRALLHTSLLSAGRPLSLKELSKLLGLSNEAVKEALEDLKQVLYQEDLGLMLEEVAGGYRLVVQPVLYQGLADLLSPPPLPQLSSAALETLALVAYKQPVTRGELEGMRGSSCSSTLDTLQERELIKVIGRKDVVGKPLLYATTERFLLEFGLNSLEDMPPLEERPSEFLRG
ncbi:MAG: SMC-Scp complex subunit ScpB [Deinococcales bacterium]